MEQTDRYNRLYASLPASSSVLQEGADKKVMGNAFVAPGTSLGNHVTKIGTGFFISNDAYADDIAAIARMLIARRPVQDNAAGRAEAVGRIALDLFLAAYDERSERIHGYSKSPASQLVPKPDISVLLADLATAVELAKF